MTKKSLLIISSLTTVVLTIPFLAMQFSEEVRWTAFDFLVAAILLFGAGFMIDIIIRKIKNRSARMAMLIAVISLFLLMWAELSVGLLGTPLAGS
ncbi:MAG TPA: hypothetical protein VJ939_03375 [Bacteroidales bacterium]|nr:hypothetical protein [Bacteroidales bacterium]